MNKKILVLSSILAVLTITAIFPMFAGAQWWQRRQRTVNGELNLYEKESEWPIRHGGVLTYTEFGSDTFRFSFRGSELKPNTEYSLIVYYTYEGDTHGILVLAEGRSRRSGYLRLSGSIPRDEFVIDGENLAGKEIQIWLVLSDDHDGLKMTDGNPADYLFGGSEITFYGEGSEDGDGGGVIF